MEKVFITGANGFIGSNLCSYFLKKNYEVYGLVRKTSDLHFLEGLDVHLISGDLCEAEKIRFPQNLDYIIHCASTVSDLADEQCCEKNIYAATTNFVDHIIDSKITIKKFIYMSSALVLGYNKLNISEENPGESALFLPYVKYKKKTECYLREALHKHNFPLIILRPADVYGPNDRTSCLLIIKGIDDGIPPIVGHGSWILPFCYVENLCLATHLACQTENNEGQAYTITNDSDVTWKEIFTVFLRRLQKKQWVYIPVFLPYLIAFSMKMIHFVIPSLQPSLTYYRIKRITTDTHYDISKTIRELKYAPDKNLKNQLNTIMDWYLAEKTRDVRNHAGHENFL